MIVNTVFHPLDQFEIYKFILGLCKSLSLYLSFTNFEAEVVVIVRFMTRCVFFIKLNRSRLNRVRTTIIKFMEFIAMLVTENLYTIVRYNVFFVTFVVLAGSLGLINIVGMIPYQFTLTSHLMLTFWIAGSIFVAINYNGLLSSGIKLFNLLLPSGIPVVRSIFFSLD